MQENITERVKYLIHYFLGNYTIFEQLTGISGSKWRDLDRGKTKSATIEMVEAICETWPEFACWLVTGSPRCTRNQTSVDMYFGSAHGLNVLEPATTEFIRNSDGHLTIRGLLMGHWANTESAEIALCERVLNFSGLTNNLDAKILAPKFWEQFIKNIKNDSKWTGEARETKKWINQFDITPTHSSDLKTLLTNGSSNMWMTNHDD